MKLTPIPALCLLFLALTSNNLKAADSAEKYWNFEDYLELRTRSGGLLMKLSYGVFKDGGFDGRVRWKFTNVSNGNLYRVDLGDRIYKLSDGRESRSSATRVKNVIRPGESCLLPVDYAVASLKKTTVSLVGVKVEAPAITLSRESNGKRISWRELGKVSAPRKARR